MQRGISPGLQRHRPILGWGGSGLFRYVDATTRTKGAEWRPYGRVCAPAEDVEAPAALLLRAVDLQASSKQITRGCALQPVAAQKLRSEAHGSGQPGRWTAKHRP